MIYNLDKVPASQQKKLGGKGMNLAKLADIGIQIPNGLVVSSDFFRTFLMKNNIYSLHREFVQKLVLGEECINTREKLVKAILYVEFSDEEKQQLNSQVVKLSSDNFAVRSSGTLEDSHSNSFAGIFETCLNVGKENILDKIKLCWASNYSDKVTTYISLANINTETFLMAVVIQEMICADISGVCFTKNPITSNENEYVIEVIFGLGAPLVDGIVTPDTYIVSIQENQIKAHYKNPQDLWMQAIKNNSSELTSVPFGMINKDKITEEQLFKIVETAFTIRNNYVHSQDIEFCLVNNDIFILQTRPITT